MAIIVIGILIGAIWGAFWGDGFGWIGALLGGLSLSVFQLFTKSQEQERQLKILSADSAVLKEKLNQLNSLASAKPISPASTQGSVVDTKGTGDQPHPESLKDRLAKMGGENAIANEIASNGASAQAPAEVAKGLPAELGLPDLDEAALQMSSVKTGSDPWIGVKDSAKQVNEPDYQQATINPLNSLFIKLKGFFLQGNPVVRVGMVVMFFGMCFLVKYASANGLLPIEFRLAGALIGAAILIAIGWKTRTRAGGFGLVLQGGGIAILYLTIFASAKLYHLMPLVVAFTLLAAVVCCGVVLSVLQNAQVLAVMSAAGGFAAPIITSDGQGNHIGLFSFYLILNLGILAVAFAKSWRLLNWIGFVFTFVIANSWGVLQYQPSMYWTTQPFLMAFFVLFLTVSLLFSFKQTPELKGLVDGSLVFGLPLVAFSAQYLLLKDTEYGLAVSAVVISFVYLMLAAWLIKRFFETHEVLATAFLALGFGFITLAIPLALDAQWTSVTWAMEAAGVIWIGIRQDRLRPRVVGYLLHFGAAVALAQKGFETGVWPVISGSYLSMLILALSAYWISYICAKETLKLRSAEAVVGVLFLMAGVFWWHLANIMEISAHALSPYRFAEVLLYFSVCIFGGQWVAQRLNWSGLFLTNYLIVLLIVISSVGASLEHQGIHPFGNLVWLSLLLALVAAYRFLKSDAQASDETSLTIPVVTHLLLGYFLLYIPIWELQHQIVSWQLNAYWAHILWFAVFAFPLVGLMTIFKQIEKRTEEDGDYALWPFTSLTNVYRYWIPFAAWTGLGLVFLINCFNSGQTPELSYIPLLNPLDLAQCFTLLLFFYGLHEKYFGEDIAEKGWILIGGALFLLVNLIFLRAVSFYFSVDFNPVSLWHSSVAQVGISILWTLSALVVMNLARRNNIRKLWMLGAGLLAVVVLKLFTKDLSDSGTLANIISFLVVGGLMLLIGYLSPVPKDIDDETAPLTDGAANNTLKSEG